MIDHIILCHATLWRWHLGGRLSLGDVELEHLVIAIVIAMVIAIVIAIVIASVIAITIAITIAILIANNNNRAGAP